MAALEDSMHSRAQHGTACNTCEAMMRADVVLPVPGGLQQAAPRPRQLRDCECAPHVLLLAYQ